MHRVREESQPGGHKEVFMTSSMHSEVVVSSTVVAICPFGERFRAWEAFPPSDCVLFCFMKSYLYKNVKLTFTYPLILQKKNRKEERKRK